MFQTKHYQRKKRKKRKKRKRKYLGSKKIELLSDFHMCIPCLPVKEKFISVEKLIKENKVFEIQKKIPMKKNILELLLLGKYDILQSYMNKSSLNYEKGLLATSLKDYIQNNFHSCIVICHCFDGNINFIVRAANPCQVCGSHDKPVTLCAKCLVFTLCNTCKTGKKLHHLFCDKVCKILKPYVNSLENKVNK